MLGWKCGHITDCHGPSVAVYIPWHRCLEDCLQQQGVRLVGPAEVMLCLRLCGPSETHVAALGHLGCWPDPVADVPVVLGLVCV